MGLRSPLRRGDGRRSGAAALLAIAILALAVPAAAGNRASYLIGGRAAGMGGAFTSFADDGSAAWYNPAGLAFQNRHSFDLSASAYGFEFLDVEGMVITKLGGQTKRSDYSPSGLLIVPTTLDAVYRITRPDAKTRHVLSFSLFVPMQRDLSQTFDFAQDALQYRQRVNIEEQASRYFVGPSYGVSLADWVSVGASLFFVYDQVKSNAELLFHQDAARSDLFFLLTERRDGSGIGIMAAASALFRFGGFRIGAQVRSPVFRFYKSLDVRSSAAVGDPARTSTAIVSDYAEEASNGSEWGLEIASPVEMALGIGYDSPGRWRLGADLHWHSSYRNSAESDNYRNTVNVAIGGEVYLTRTLPLSFGLFTDFHPEKEVTIFNDRQMDFYGGTVALSIVSPYDVTGSAKTDRITFATTIGFHYAYGTGEIVGMRFDYDEGTWGLEMRPAKAHDVHVTLGSMVRY